MAITYSMSKEFTSVQLRDLFLSVKWSSGNFPDKLRMAMLGSDKVISAWDGDRLIGLINSLSDGIMTAYFHYLLVQPEYHDMGIGKHLVETMVNEYRGFARIVLIAYDQEVGFYLKNGFVVGEGKTPMFITSLTT